MALCLPLSAKANLVDNPGFEDRHYISAAFRKAGSFRSRAEAEVWLMSMSERVKRWMPDKRTRYQFLRQVHRQSALNGIPPEVVLAVIYVESRFNSKAISSADARGLMQVMPFWTSAMGGGKKQDDLHDMQTNIRYGTAILAHYLKKEKGDWERALARYNGSLGKTWYPDKVFNALNNKILITPESRNRIVAAMEQTSARLY
jgi:soluble lytic murein transglycosylase-like protein